MTDWETSLREKTAYADSVLLSFLPGSGEGDSLTAAMTYALKAGGKRLRPLLMRESWQLFGGGEDRIEPFMAAIEMIHTHSLIHDDLPALDDDDLRRGRPTAHKVYGEAMAILSGDALLNYAYEVILDRASGFAHPDRVLAALGILAAKTGCRGMLGGQSLDVENDKKGRVSLDRRELDTIYLRKTGALLEASLMVGAVLAGAGQETVSGLESLGREIGLAFQIRDDMLDVTSTEEELGKPIHSDDRNTKETYVSLLGLEGAGAEVLDRTGRALQILRELPGMTGDPGFLEWLIERMGSRRK